MKDTRISNSLRLAVIGVSLFAATSAAQEPLRSRSASGTMVTIEDVCRVKGQESNRIHGMGLVVGLNGTGDTSGPTNRALSRAMNLLGSPLATSARGVEQIEELKNIQNAALVFVSTEIPSTGVREGGKLVCEVNAIGAKSLQGGYLVSTTLVGGRPTDQTAYAVAEGALEIEDKANPTTAQIRGGCRMVADIPSVFLNNGHLTLVLQPHHARFTMAQEIEYTINAHPEFKGLARALDAKNIVVQVPAAYSGGGEVAFVAALQNIQLNSIPPHKRVVVNQKTGVIVIGEEVEIRRVAIGHKNLIVEVGGNRAAAQFVPISPNTSTEKLQSLVTALNALRVSTDEQIEILKMIQDQGGLYGELIIK